jgi:hypothetical protein
MVLICAAEPKKNTFVQGCKDQLLDGHCPLEIMSAKCPGGQAPCVGWGLVHEVWRGGAHFRLQIAVWLHKPNHSNSWNEHVHRT